MGYHIIRRILFCLPPECAHAVTMKLLRFFYWPSRVRRKQKQFARHPVSCFGLTFPNRIGLAAGLDKNGDYIDALFGLGFGFIEVGCVTPQPQVGNPRPRIFRIPSQRALINRMGFNNKGVDYLVERLKARRVPGIIGANIGKNKSTPNASAHEDYLICLEKLYPHVDFMTINISSPNTPGLRDLSHIAELRKLLTPIVARRDQLAMEHQKKMPLLLKLTVDFSKPQYTEMIPCAQSLKIDGLIISNTTVDHSRVSACRHGQEQGGLSGKPLHAASVASVAFAKQLCAGALPIIGVGGIENQHTAQDFFDAGADLVQVYTGLIYEGPALIRRLLQRSFVD